MENEKKPIGWSERYRMTTPDMTELDGAMAKVKKWIADGRGIAVWVNVDLSGGPLNSKFGHITYTPGDCGKPHWSYVLVEKLPDASRIDFFRLEVITDKPRSKMKAAEVRDMARGGWEYDKRTKEWFREVPVPQEDNED